MPIPKIIDFGVAKAVNQQLTDKTVFTGYGQMLGTPLYMSPEQAEMSCVDVDTRSDIYSLGVLLYELLTGSTPFDSQRLREAGLDGSLPHHSRGRAGPAQPAHQHAAGEALATVTQHRGADLRRLGQLLRGDLDWIVMKALEKDRTRRYESASALAADVQRYLADEPVQARPPTLAHRAAKWTRRHRPLVWAAAAPAFAVVAVLAASGILLSRPIRGKREAPAAVANPAEARRTQPRRRRTTRRRAGQSIRCSTCRRQGLSRIPEMKEIRQRLLEDAAGFYCELIKLNPRDPLAYFGNAAAFTSG